MRKHLCNAGFILAFNAIWEMCAMMLFHRDPERVLHCVVDVTWAVLLMLFYTWMDSREAEKANA